jgi:hypothetical protein
LSAFERAGESIYKFLEVNVLYKSLSTFSEEDMYLKISNAERVFRTS